MKPAFAKGVFILGPKSNAERQREFRKRNPGYHKRYYVSAKQYREQAVARERLRIANDPQLLLFPGERPAMLEPAA